MKLPRLKRHWWQRGKGATGGAWTGAGAGAGGAEWAQPQGGAGLAYELPDGRLLPQLPAALAGATLIFKGRLELEGAVVRAGAAREVTLRAG